MKKIRVGVAGYGTIGQRLADGVAMQEDMELVGIADLAPTLSIRALRENDMVGANGVTYRLPGAVRQRGHYAGCIPRRRGHEKQGYL